MKVIIPPKLLQPELHQPILDAVTKNDVETMKSIISQSTSKNNTFLLGEYLLIYAAQHGANDIIDCLIDFYGVPVDTNLNQEPKSSSKDIYNVLYIAWTHKHYTTFDLLLTKHRADVGVMLEFGRDCITSAIDSDDINQLSLIKKLSPSNMQAHITRALHTYKDKPHKFNSASFLIREYGVKVDERGFLTKYGTLGNIEVFDFIMRFDPPIDTTDVKGITAVQSSAIAKQWPLCKHIIQRYCPSTNSLQQTFRVVIEGGQVELFELILSMLDIKALDRSFLYSCLIAAATGGSIDIVKQLLFTYEIIPFYDGKTVDSKYNNFLHLIVKNNNLELLDCVMQSPYVKQLLEVEDQRGRTPTSHAVYEKAFLTAEMLLTQYKTKIDDKGNDGKNILHYAVEHNDLKFLQFALDYNEQNGNKIKVTQQDGAGNTIILSAAQLQDTTILKYLLTQQKKYKFDLNDRNDAKKGILHFLTNRPTFTANELNEIITIGENQGVNTKFNINIDDKDDNTPSILAAQQQNWDIVKLLLIERGADGNQKNNYGKTVLHIIASFGIISILDELIVPLQSKQYPLKYEINDYESRTPFLVALAAGHFAFAKHFFQQYRCNLNDTDSYDNNLFHFIAKYNDVGMLQFFSEQTDSLKVKPGAYNKERQTPLIIAAQARQWNSIPTDNLNITVEHNVAKCDFIRLYLQLYGKDMDMNHTDRAGTSIIHPIVSFSNYDCNIDIVESIMQYGGNVNIQNATKQTPLMIAIKNKNFNIAECLLTKYNADVKIANGLDCPFRALLEHRDPIVLQRFLPYNLIQAEQCHALVQGFASKNEQFVEFLITYYKDYFIHHSAKILSNIAIWAPLPLLSTCMNAYAFSFDDINQALKSSNVDNTFVLLLNYGGTPTKTAYTTAVLSNRLDILQLIERFPDTSYCLDFNMIIAAIKRGYNDIVIYLLSKVTINMVSVYEAIKACIDNTHYEMSFILLQYLFSQYPTIKNEKCFNDGQLVSMAAAYSRLDILQYFIYQLQYNINGNNQFIPIFAAIKYASQISIEWLLNNHADTLRRDKEGRTIIYFAIKQCREQQYDIDMIDQRLIIVDYLLSLSINTGLCHICSKTFLLLYAAEKGTLSAMKHLILKYHANCNVTTEKGKSIVILALKSGNKPAYKYAKSIYKKDSFSIQHEQLLQQHQH